MKATHKLYLMIDPRDGQVRKVGVSMKPEDRVNYLFAICRYIGSERPSPWFAEMKDAGVRPRVTVLSEFEDKSEARRFERLLSAAFRIAGVPIVNAEGEVLARELMATH